MTTLSAEELHQKGVKYFNGEGVKQNVNKAIDCFEQAITLGSVDSKRALGSILLNGIDGLSVLSFGNAQQRRGLQLIDEAACEGDTLAKEWYIENFARSGLFLFLFKLRFLMTFKYIEARRRAKIAMKYKEEMPK